MGMIKPEVARIYPEKYKIRFDELRETAFEPAQINVDNFHLEYLLDSARININSGIQNRHQENIHFMGATVWPDRLLSVELVTWEKVHGYFPLFHAHSFLTMILEHFSGRFDAIEADLYNDPGRDQIYQEFFSKYSPSQTPEQVALNTKVGKWFASAGYSNIEPDRHNIYNKSFCDHLKFVFYR